MIGADDRRAVRQGMLNAVDRICPVEVERLAHAIGVRTQDVPVDLVVAHSRDVALGGSAIEISAEIIAGSADPGLWTRELLGGAEVTVGVIAIAAAVCTRCLPDHPLANLTARQVSSAKAFYDFCLRGGVLSSVDGGGELDDASGIILLDLAAPLESWIVASGGDANGGAKRETLGGVGRFADLLEESVREPGRSVYLGPLVAILSGLSNRG